MTPQTPLPGKEHATLLHRALAIGLAVGIGVGVAVVAISGAPFLGIGPNAGILRYVLSGAGLLTLLVAQVLVRPRLPERTPGQARDAYWSETRALVPALRFWTLLEGGGMMAVVGHILGGGLVPIVAAGLALCMLVLLGPARLAGE